MVNHSRVHKKVLLLYAYEHGMSMVNRSRVYGRVVFLYAYEYGMSMLLIPYSYAYNNSTLLCTLLWLTIQYGQPQ
jgi:hypothetical protein